MIESCQAPFFLPQIPPGKKNATAFQCGAMRSCEGKSNAIA